MIPYSTQSIDATDFDAVLETLSSPYLTCGPKVTEFENAVCEYTGARHAVAVNSCTSALHLAMMALGVGKEDTVYVSAVSFVASANCARMCGARVEFVDVDPISGNLDVAALEAQLQDAAEQNALPKVLVAVDMAGRRCDFAAVKRLSLTYGFKIVEDAAHALGASYCGDRTGSGKYADITCLSFHPVKIITTCEGGMALTDDETLASRMRALSSHGIVRDEDRLCEKGRPAFYYEMQELGFNYRMSDLHAALGLSQMSRLNVFLEMRRKKARLYEELLKDCHHLRLPAGDDENSQSAWHLYQVEIKNGRRDEIYRKMREAGIGVQIHYLPIYDHPYYRALGGYHELTGAESFYRGTLSIPLYPTLSNLKQQMVAAKLCSLCDRMQEHQ